MSEPSIEQHKIAVTAFGKASREGRTLRSTFSSVSMATEFFGAPFSFHIASDCPRLMCQQFTYQDFSALMLDRRTPSGN